MQDNWYSPAETAPAPVPSPVKKRRAKWLTPTLCAAGVLLLIGVSSLLFRQNGSQPLPDDNFSGFSGSPLLPDSPEVPDYAEDYREYFDSFYTALEPADECGIPRVGHYDGATLSLVPASGEALTLQEIYKKCAPWVVAIHAYVDGSSEDSYYWGTGIVMTADGYILTNAHIIEGTVRARITLSDDRDFEAKLVGYDSRSDVAVLKIDARGLTPAEFGDSASLTVGDAVVAIGNPLSEQFRSTMTEGIISGIGRDISYNGTTLTLVQTSTPINEGNSGGPLINMAGQVVGITNMKMSASYFGSASIEGVGFAIPSATLKSMADSLLSAGEVLGRPALGITVGGMPARDIVHYDLPEGLYISAVAEGSDCAAKDVRVGDILLAVNGQPVTATADVTLHIAELSVGDTLTLTLYRDGETLDVTVALVDVNDVY